MGDEVIDDGPAGPAARARSFGAVARAYAEHRPGYPAAAVDWLLAGLPGPARVLDLGAGTGKVTEGLLDRADVGEVTAVEPDPAMRAELRRRLPSVSALAGTAEAIPLPDASVDAVLVGQAFHWFDIEPALAETARVLAPGGVLGVLANRDDGEVAWVRGYYETVGQAQRGGPGARPRPLPEHPAFAPAERAEFAHPVPTTMDGMLATLGTYSWISTLPEADRARTVAEARAYLLARPELPDDPSAPLVLPMRTAVVRLARAEARR